jgi:hypothetical protein
MISESFLRQCLTKIIIHVRVVICQDRLRTNTRKTRPKTVVRPDGGLCPEDTLALAFSTDGGASFTPWQCKPALVNTNSQASVLVTNVSNRETILVSNPGLNPTHCPPCSLNMRVHASHDGGVSFERALEFEVPGARVWNGTHNNGTAGGYSSLVELDQATHPGMVGLAWETGGPGGSCIGSRCRVVFSRFNVSAALLLPATA